MKAHIDLLLIILCFAALVALWLFSVFREKRLAEKLYRAIEGGLLSEVKSTLAKQAFPNLRSWVVANAIERAVEARQPAVLDFLLSEELRPVSLTQRLDSFLYEQSQKGGWRGVVLWRYHSSHLFEPWRDLGKSDKLKLRSRATRDDTAATSKSHLKFFLGRWTVP